MDRYVFCLSYFTPCKDEPSSLIPAHSDAHVALEVKAILLLSLFLNYAFVTTAFEEHN
jgi:hypothetical protein